MADWQIGDWIIFTEAGATDVWQKIDAQSSTFQATDSTFIDFTPTTLQTGTVTLTGDLKIMVQPQLIQNFIEEMVHGQKWQTMGFKT